MSTCTIIDTYSAFIEFWAGVCTAPVEQQIARWATKYMAKWPELLRKQVQDYECEGLDWRQVAAEKIFPFLAERLPDMQLAHKNLLRSCEPIYRAARQKLRYDVPPVFVIYTGIGLGAGWATTYQGSPAVLFGLENIAEEGWSRHEAIAELIAHELGHLIHYHWRAQSGKAIGSGPWWQLYEEGFAQRCAHEIMGEETWYMTLGAGYRDWQEWCIENKSWLAAEFLRSAETGEDVRPFFGSWLTLHGQKQTGYFLGLELIKQLETKLSLEEIATIDDVDGQFKSQAIANIN